MRDSPSHDGPLAFGEFLEHLRRQGFTIGVGEYLRLQHLLSKTGGRCAPSDLKTLICPLFATSEAQQEQFYAAFDIYFDLFRSPAVATHSDDALEKNSSSAGRSTTGRRRELVYALAGAALILVTAFALQLTSGRIAPSGQQPKPGAGVQEDLPTNQSSGNRRQTNEPKNSNGNNNNRNDNENAGNLPQIGPQENFYRRLGKAIYVGAIFAPLIFFLIYEWHRFRRRTLVLKRQRGRRPPFVWPLRVEASASRPYDSRQLYAAARFMRRRQVGEFHRLDVDATIDATIASQGYPSYRYRPDSKPPEYLVLIDRSCYRDHQARLFDELTGALSREGVFIARYFYDGDPRVCRNERGDSFHLVELQNKYSEHQLLVFGSGERIVDPITGKLEPWASSFSVWKARALLNPEAPSKWSLKEISLAEQFVVLPATLQGLAAGADYFELRVSTGQRPRQPDRSDAPPSDLEQPGVVGRLRAYLGEEVFQWLCACSVYPEIHWDLTLYLGSLDCMPEGLVQEENLLKLIRLPWFRGGSMPDDLRWLLLRELDTEKERAVRAAIIGLLEKHPPPKETFAADAYQLNLVVQRWLLRRERKRRREMLKFLEMMPQGRAVGDYTLLRFLESARNSPLDFLLPRRLRSLFYQQGIPAFGLRTGARLLAAIILSAAVLSTYIRLYLPVTQAPAMDPLELRLEQMIARFTPADIAVDTSSLSDGDLAALSKIIGAAKLMDPVFIRQVWGGNEALLTELQADESSLGRARLHYFMINKGPWSRLDGNEPFIEGVPIKKPREAGFYPEDMTKGEFSEWYAGASAQDQRLATSFYAVVRREPNGRLKAVSYSDEYRVFLQPAAKLLREAAALTHNQTLRSFLDKRADAFLNDDYYASDAAWMDLDSPIDVTIGPYETYEDELFGYKAAFEAFVALRDDAESAKLVMLSGQLQELENNLPIDPRYRNPKLGAASPIRVVDVVFAAGDGNRGVQTAAFNLPNDEQVVREKGSKRVMLKNVQEAKFTKVLIPISKIAMDSLQQSRVSFDAFFTHILMHELVHGIGPHNIKVQNRDTTVRLELKELYSTIEETKADIVGLWALQYLIDHGAVVAALERGLYTTYLASAFRSVRFGATEAHGKGQALQFNYLLDAGAIRMDESSGVFSIDDAKIKDAVLKLATEILTIEAEGSYNKAKALLDKYAIVRPAMQRMLDRLANVPVDIEPRFTVAERVR